MQMFKCSPSQMFQDMEQSPAMRSPKLNHETWKPPRKAWLSSLQKKERQVRIKFIRNDMECHGHLPQPRKFHLPGTWTTVEVKSRK